MNPFNIETQYMRKPALQISGDNDRLFNKTFYFFFLPDYSGYDFHYYQNKTGESRHPCLVTDLRRKAFNLSPLSLVLAVGLSYQPLLP